MLSGVCVTCLIRYCRIVAADLMARLALQKGAARRMAEAGAIAHLLPLLDYVDMDGPLLLEEDIATGLDFSNGVVSVSGKPGLGIEWLGGAVEQHPLSIVS